VPTSTAPATYRQRLARWNRAVARVRLHLAKVRLSRDRRKRARIVAVARWGAAHQPQIHYAETRPIPLQGAGTLPRLPLTTDCSGFVTCCYRAAAAPDPNGAHYNGQGFTGTLLGNGRKVDKPKPGDVVVYGTGEGHHAALIVEGGVDPLTVSHGSEAGPLLIRVSAERHYQPPGTTYLRFPVA
jgi:cell wall-associated NlpC family hydrolase